MRATCLLLWLLNTTHYINAQVAIDSTYELIQKESYDEAISYAADQVDQTDDNFVKARLLQLIADSYYYVNDINTSLSYYIESVEHYSQSDYQGNLFSEAISHTGFCYRELGQFDKAFTYYQRALDMAYAIENEVEIAHGHSNLGSIYAKLGNLKKANEHFSMAYNLDVKLEDTASLGFDLRNLAEMEMLSGDYINAQKHIKESIILLESSSGNANSYALRLGALGNSYAALNSYDSARYYYDLSTSELEKLGDTLNVVNTWIAIAELERDRGNDKIAKAYIDKVGNLIPDDNDETAFRLKARAILADIYLNEDQYNKARELIISNVESSQKMGQLTTEKDSWLLLSTLEERLGNNLKALAAYRNYKSISDSIINQSSKNTLQELNIRYQVDNLDQKNKILQLEREVARAEAANKEARIWWIIVASTLLISAVIVISLVFSSRQRLKNKLLAAEVNQLRNQIKLAVEGEASAMKLEIDVVNNQLATPLTDREFEILQYAITDISNNEIAQKAYVSVNTVKYHLKNIYEKIGAANKKEVLKFALNLNN